jgi:hypothetical protein
MALKPTRFGTASGATVRNVAIKPQPLPSIRRAMVFPMDSTPYNGFRIGTDPVMCASALNHNPDSQHFIQSFEKLTADPQYPFANGYASTAPTPGAAAYFDGFYWIEKPEQNLVGNVETVKGWSSLAAVGAGPLDAPVEVADAVVNTYGSEVTFGDWQLEVDARLAAFQFPIAQGPDHNLVVERDDSGNFITNRSDPTYFNTDVLEVCMWCIGENSFPSTYTFYQFSYGTAVSPPNLYWRHADEYGCRKAPWGPWWEMPCDQPVSGDQHPRFFAFHYVKTIKIADLADPVTGTYIDQPAEYRNRRSYTREIPAVWKGRIRVTGFTAGEPYRHQFFPQDDSGEFVETIRYADGDYVDIEPPEANGFIRILPAASP